VAAGHRRSVPAYQERGLVDVITCAATHGFLPLLGTTPGAVRAQVEVAIAEYRRFFGRGRTASGCRNAPTSPA
jgi:predicted glycosyl hydrolase (DUF1957 family)